MSKKIDLTGQKFERLTVLYEAEPRIQPSGQRKRMWHCVCDCGNEADIQDSALRSGNTKSCGCYNLEKIRERAIKHGYNKRGNKHPLYTVWQGIKARCLKIDHKQYKYYGGRGITICEEWLDNPKEFIDWCLVNGWKQGLQIDRIDNDGNYEPDNCRFVTNRENVLNQRFLTSKNTSGYRGVSWHKKRKKWVAGIRIYGKFYYLGLFSTKEEAALSYNKEAEKHNYKLNVI